MAQNINQSILTFTFSCISTENVSVVTAAVVATINVDTVVLTGVSVTAGTLVHICQLSGNTSRFTHLTKQQQLQINVFSETERSLLSELRQITEAS